MKKGVQLFTILLLIYSANCRPNTDTEDYDSKIAEEDEGFQNDNYDYGPGGDDDESEVPDPILRTRPADFIAKENETVRLPCEIENGGSMVSMWRKNSDELIFQDALKFNSFGDNFQIDFQQTNRTLVIKNVGINETASYTCYIPLSKNESLNVTHRLFVQTSPRIVSLKALHDATHIDQGKSITLTCHAVGFPKPTIKWSHKGEALPQGETLTIDNVGHHDTGDYQCLADNAIEPPAHRSIHIAVTQKPVIKLEKVTVNTDEKLDAELFCYVHGSPKPDVVWKKDGTNIVSSDRYNLKDSKQTHTLVIKNVKTEDFGVYTCSAYNRVGKTESNVTLTAFPSPPELSKVTHKHNQTQLIWILESKSPIIEYQLDYKNIEEERWRTVSPPVVDGENNVYTVNYTLTNLEIGKHYHARLRSKNTYGWSANSEPVKFVSAKPHDHHKALNKPEHDKEELGFQSSHNPNENEVFVQEPIVESHNSKSQESKNTQQKSQTQEEPRQAAKAGEPTDGAFTNSPVFTLIFVSILSIIFSR